MSKSTPQNRSRITKTFVEGKLEPGRYFDSVTKGFHLKVTSAGNKIYCVWGKVKGYTNAKGQSVPITYTIGHHGQPAIVTGNNGKKEPVAKLSAEMAEREAQIIWGLMKGGINPNEEKDKQAAVGHAERVKKEGLKKIKEYTLQRVLDDYLENKRTKNGPLKKSTKYIYRCVVESCLADWLDKPITDISDEDVRDRHRRISKEHPGDANHVMRVLRALFNYAADEYKLDRQPIIKSNPVKPLSKKREWNKLQERKNIIPDHYLKVFFEACKQLEHSTASDYLPFLLLTGLRAEEAASLKWDQVFLKERTIHITETKNGKEHWLPLTDYLHALLKTRARVKTDRYVFSNGNDGYMSDYRYQIDRVIEKCRQLLVASDDEDIQSKAMSFTFIPHDLRRTFGTIAARLQPDYIVKKLLNHTNTNDVTQTHYFHADVEKLKEPMQAISSHILNHAGLIDYEKPALLPISKVVQFPKSHKKASL